jgi:cell growth-regulating nucleolar protein
MHFFDFIIFHYTLVDYMLTWLKSCMTEAQKYEGALYKPKQAKNGRKGNNNNNPRHNANANTNGHRAPYVEDVPDSDNAKRKASALPAAPTPPLTGTEKSGTAQEKNTQPVNVFDFLVNDQTPNASKVSLNKPKEQMQMVDHAPSVFEASKALAHYETGGEDEDKQYDLPYEQNGYSYGAGPIPPSVYAGKAPNASMEFMTPAPKKKNDRSRKDNVEGGATASDKKRKRHAEDQDMEDADTPMLGAPSSVLNHPGTPMLNHSGLTGGLSRMLRSPSLEAENGHADHPRRRYQDPSSPIKRTRRAEKDGADAGLGISMKNRAERLVSSMFGGPAISESGKNGHESSSKEVSRSRQRSASDDGDVDLRRSKKSQRVTSDTQKSKRKSSAQMDGRPSRRLKQIEYPAGSRSTSPRGDNGRQIVVYQQPNIPNELQRQMAANFLSLVTKGPESQRGFSVNKVLKRFHRDFTDEFDDDRGREQGRSRADHEQRTEDEKDLWRTLRIKRNDRGEIVLFM